MCSMKLVFTCLATSVHYDFTMHTRWETYNIKLHVIFPCYCGLPKFSCGPPTGDHCTRLSTRTIVTYIH